MSTSQRGRVSVIIPARNEEANIARVLKSLAGQEGIQEILVVDDQSTDRTAEILAALAKEMPLLRILRVDSLPEGWMGKTHALTQAARVAVGEWLLFTDADTEHFPGSLPELLERAERAGADLLSVSPGQETRTWWEKSVIPLVYVHLASLFRFADVSDPQSPAAAANGQYLLVRRSAYERSGGQGAVKAAVLEDVELARSIKAAGGKLLFLPGASWVQTRMYGTFAAMWQGWTKNLYLLYGGKTSAMIKAAAWLELGDVLPVLAFVAMGFWVGVARGGAVATLLAVGWFGWALARQWRYGRALGKLGYDPAVANYLPIGAALLGALLLNSLRVHRTGGKIEWKGRRYATKGME